MLARLGRPRVQGVLLDLGVSSLQIDDPGRGFAYAQDAPLDMRMGRQELTAADGAQHLLARPSWPGSCGATARSGSPTGSPGGSSPSGSASRSPPRRRLVQLLYDAIPMATRKTGGHPAKRTFQALRIEVNAELAALESVLPSAVAALAVGGRIAVLAYHSLEDRLVKQILTIGAHDRAPRDLPVVPPGLGAGAAAADPRRPAADARRRSAVNPRAASARLRAAERIDEPTSRNKLEVSA